MPLLMLIAVLVFAASTACLQASSVSVGGIINQPNGLGLGGSDDGIQVSFIEVLSDTRCPEGVTCIDAGEAEVKIGVSVNSAPQEEVVLKVVPVVTTTYQTGDYTVKIVRLLPDPPPMGGVEQSDYQLELHITRD